MLVPVNDHCITEDTTLAPGVYLLPQGLEIAADGVTLDGNGALLVGMGRSGSGLRIRGRQGVTIRNLRLSEYYHGIVADDCRDLTIEQCTMRATAEEPANTLFLDIWRPAERAYGGGILLRGVQGGRIVGNDLQHQQNGLLCYHCARLTVQANVANHCSGFGFHLFASCDCRLEANSADFCCRYEPRPNGGHVGADAAGFLIVHGSCRNSFRANTARMGGDGFFLAGLRPDWVHVPCNDNRFEGNDASYSPNIAFEATFSSANVFVNNVAHGGNYGFWLGFSAANRLENNTISANRRAGIAVENGIDCSVQQNTISANAYGILLWSNYVAPFAQAVPANDTSRNWLIVGNRFVENGVAVRIAADQDHGVRPLSAPTLRCPPPRDHTLRANHFVRNRRDLDVEGAEPPFVELA
jgi:parallel beta-helix repeat protein